MQAISTIVAAVMAAAAYPSIAQASSGPEVSVVTAQVSYADLALSRPDGRMALERRVQAAIERVCLERPAPTELRLMEAYDACHKAAWDGARRQLAAIYNQPALAVAAAGPGGH